VFDIVEEQRIRPAGSDHRFEGIAFSPDGSLLAVATSESNAVFLYRHASGRLAEEPFAAIAGPRSGLRYPHDVAFSTAGDLMAVALRKEGITVYEKRGEGFAPQPAFVIRGRRTRLNFSDGVQFVPPDGDSLAACNLASNSISFYRMLSRSPLVFELEPSFELKDDSLYEPDGLGFSSCGRWLAVANHGQGTVAIFERAPGGDLRYGPQPVALLRHRTLRYPHSVAFTPGTNHLFVTNAGANFFSVFGPTESAGRVHPRCARSSAPITSFAR
jgi:DNA-binding beta-propeller fold protein YncE